MEREKMRVWHAGEALWRGCSASKKHQLLAMARLIRQWPFLLTASNRNAHFRSRGPEKTSDFGQGGNASDSDSESYKSRKQKKCEARLAVRWGMELASFSPPQIKRIIKVASLEKDVFDALMLVKGFSGLEEKIIGDHNEESGERENDVEEEGSHEYIDIATSCFGGLINRDIKVINEVYALRSIDFDSQAHYHSPFLPVSLHSFLFSFVFSFWMVRNIGSLGLINRWTLELMYRPKKKSPRWSNMHLLG
ncbi:hypothetical protein NC653_005195 [Populus alba x Populus x berolinensis]|uniref:Uncharacterized protein n=1 Tax=Populus alba x Populus x berolinensis TaxID=444605 RepID=A0AAD6RBB7_9ROSI|nr:hypothetical protein NC653_005195 [Populus alba x Populus x berolinensis]